MEIELIRSQVTLTPAESKRLIAKAILKTDVFLKAFKNGKIVIHPSSTTYFILKELNIELPDKVWVIGLIAPSGGHIEKNYFLSGSVPQDPNQFRHSWIIEKGRLKPKKALIEILTEMSPDDVYIKGANALDINKVPAVLTGNLAGGTVSRVIHQYKERKFKILVPIGLEKLIPYSLKDVIKETGIKKIDYSMGMPCGLFPLSDGNVITEIDAIKILSGSTAFPISSGGIDGAEGAITLIIKGNKDQISQINEIIGGIKGTKLPKVEYEKQ